MAMALHRLTSRALLPGLLEALPLAASAEVDSSPVASRPSNSSSWEGLLGAFSPRPLACSNNNSSSLTAAFTSRNRRRRLCSVAGLLCPLVDVKQRLGVA